jgi:serine/threonine-protein kinase
MAAVYAATHRNGRRVAIKVLDPRWAREPEVRRRFLREGYVANRIGPGAVTILDDDTAEDDAPFLVMELLEGESLKTWLNRVGGTLPVDEVLAVACQVLGVLESAHGKKIVHRDVKPGNVFVTTSGHVKLLDFGIARIRDGVASLIPTVQGTVMGTVGYMAPEQARGLTDEVDPRSDIFSVGAVMYRALSGRRIHERPSGLDEMHAIALTPAPSLAGEVAATAPGLVAAIDRALALDKASRWQSAHEMLGALRAEARRLTRRESTPVVSVSFGDRPHARRDRPTRDRGALWGRTPARVALRIGVWLAACAVAVVAFFAVRGLMH